MFDGLFGLTAIALGFAWLLRETDWLRIRLLVGREKPRGYAQYKAYTGLTKRKFYDVEIHHGSNAEVPSGITYNIVLDPGITEPLCGWDWLDQHVADLVGWQPRVQLAIGGVRYDMTIKSQNVLNEVMKANHLSKREKIK